MDDDDDDDDVTSSSYDVACPSTTFVHDVDVSSSFSCREHVDADSVWRPW